MDLGKAVGIDRKVTLPAASFSPKDTIYISVVSDGVAPAAGLRAKWTYGPKGLPVKENTETISSLGPKATEFHIKKASGLPVGTYTVEVFVNDKSVGTKQFNVAAPGAHKKK